MSATIAPTPAQSGVFRYLIPERFRLALGLGGVALLMGIFGIASGLPLWRSALPGTFLFSAAVLVRWYNDRNRYGPLIALMVALLTFQGGHGLEHIAQWVQYHLLGYTARASSGLISAANSEWVHFLWNWGVLLVMLRIYWLGMRNPWAYMMLFWSIAHTGEHTYLFVRHLEVLQILKGYGEAGVTAQGLPGIFGNDGWLARSPVTAGSWVCTFPGFTTATRLDVHFWWNVGETILLMLAAYTHIHRHPQRDLR
jgi:hypothetical protein